MSGFWILSSTLVYSYFSYYLCTLSLLLLHVSLVLESPEVNTVLQVYLTIAEQRGKITSLDLLGLMQPRRLLAFSGNIALTQSTWCPAASPSYSLPSCFPSSCLPACKSAWDYSSPCAGLSHFSLWKSMNWTLHYWSQHSELISSATSLSIYLVHTYFISLFMKML